MVVDHRGYSGAPEAKNDPAKQNLKDKGPIPRGNYTMSGTATTTKGPYTIPLTQDAANEMFGRDGFLIHGDNPDHIGESSTGCIIMPLDVRKTIVNAGGGTLEVVKGPEEDKKKQH